MRILKAKKSFKKEFKRQIKFAIIAAVGFTIAYGWREAIFNTAKVYVSRFLNVNPEHFLTNIYTALALTICGVIIIMFTSKILKD